MSTTPETPTPDYGEPWRVVSLADGGIASRDGSPIVDKLSKSHRAISCVNTCAGMADPAAEIAAMREAIRDAHDALFGLSNWRNDCDAYDEDMGYPQRDYDEEQVEMMEETAQRSLTKLQPFLKP